MPQMSPMNWFFLFLYFNISIYLTLVKVHFLSSGLTVWPTTGKSGAVTPSRMLFLI